MQKRDYFERMIEQLAAAVAKLLGLAAEGHFDDAEQVLDDAWSSTLGMRQSDAVRLDDSTLRMMLGEKTALVAQLFEARASIEDARGATRVAEAFRKRALGLR